MVTVRILATAATCGDRRRTLKQRADAPDGYRSQTGVLAQRQLEEEERDAREDQHDDVGDQEGACGHGAAR